MPSMNAPSPNGDNGRGARGRFAVGNAGGPGNPHARRVGQIRAQLLAAVTDQDLDSIIRTLIDKAKTGEQWALKELLTRLIGDELISQPDPLWPVDDALAELGP